MAVYLVNDACSSELLESDLSLVSFPYLKTMNDYDHNAYYS